MSLPWPPPSRVRLSDRLQCSDDVRPVLLGPGHRHHLHHRLRHGDHGGIPDLAVCGTDWSVPLWRSSQRRQSLPHADLRWGETMERGSEIALWWWRWWWCWVVRSNEETHWQVVETGSNSRSVCVCVCVCRQYRFVVMVFDSKPKGYGFESPVPTSLLLNGIWVHLKWPWMNVLSEIKITCLWIKKSCYLSPDIKTIKLNQPNRLLNPQWLQQFSFLKASVCFPSLRSPCPGQQIVRNLRAALFASILRQEVAFFDRSRTGELINRLSSDTTMVGRSITDNLSDGLRAVAQAAAGVSMMVRTWWLKAHSDWSGQMSSFLFSEK